MLSARSSRCKGSVTFIVMMDTTDKCRWYPVTDYRYQSVDERYPTVDWWYLEQGIFSYTNKIV